MTRQPALGVLFIAVVMAGPAAAEAARPKADLTVGAPAGLPATAQPGTALTLRFAVKNTGRLRARRTFARTYLSRDGKKSKDDLAIGPRSKVGPLRPRKSEKETVRGVLPTLAAPGIYRALACALLHGFEL